MTVKLPDALRVPVTDLASAKAWIEALVDAGLEFHLESDPVDIERGNSGELLFFEVDLALIRRQQRALYALPRESWGTYDCPIGYLLAYENRAEVLRS